MWWRRLWLAWHLSPGEFTLWAARNNHTNREQHPFMTIEPQTPGEVTVAAATGQYGEGSEGFINFLTQTWAEDERRRHEDQW